MAKYIVAAFELPLTDATTKFPDVNLLESITRAQMAKYIVAAFELPLTDATTKFPDVNPNSGLAVYVAALANAGITVGKNDGTFGYHDQLFRGDFAAMLYRALAVEKNVPEVHPITIVGDDQGNNLKNGQAKTFTATLINPVSQKPIEGAVLNVTFAENVGTDFRPQRNVIVTNAYGDSVIPYQSNDGHEAEVKIKTDKNGKATFTITGTNATVTPIVFLDGSNQAWDTKGGIKIETQDGRFDEEFEYYAKAEPVTFSITPYNITVTGQRTNYAAVAEVDENGLTTEHNGRKYKIAVTKPDGNPYGGGIVNVGIYELLDGKLGNEPTGAYFAGFTDETGHYLTQGQVKLDSKGEATVVLASTYVNDSAEPIVWIDQNMANNFQPGTFEEGEPMSDHTKVEPTNFQPVRVDEGALGAELIVDHNDSVGAKIFKMNILNQSGKIFNPGKEVKAHVTFEVVNTGAYPVEINTSLFKNLELTDAVDVEREEETVVIEVGGRVTISGDTSISTATLSVNAVDGVSSIQVRGSAVMFADVGNESNSVYVFTDFVEAILPYSYEADILSTVAEDRDGNGSSDQVVLTFDKEVHHFEAGDFRITHGGATYSANSVTKDEKKLILTFSEDAFINGTTTLKYDPNYSGTEVLSDEFGNKVKAFQVEFISEGKADSGEKIDSNGEENVGPDDETNIDSNTDLNANSITETIY